MCPICLEKTYDVEAAEELHQKTTKSHSYIRFLLGLVFKLAILGLGCWAIYLLKIQLDEKQQKWELEVSPNQTLVIFRGHAYTISGFSNLTVSPSGYRPVGYGAIELDFNLPSPSLTSFNNLAPIYVRKSGLKKTSNHTSDSEVPLTGHEIKTIREDLEFSTTYVSKIVVNPFLEEIPTQTVLQYQFEVAPSVEGPWNVISFNRSFFLDIDDDFWRKAFHLVNEKSV